MKTNESIRGVLEMEHDMANTLDSAGLGEVGIESAGRLKHEAVRQYPSRDEMRGDASLTAEVKNDE